MLEKPDLPDGRICSVLHQSYGLRGATIEFLPWGYDSNAAVYRVHVAGRESLFLKLRRGVVNEASLLAPRFLKDSGIGQVVAPLPARDQSLWQRVDDFALILYPFVEGRVGAEVGLSDSQWLELGTVLGRIHAANLPPALRSHLKRDAFAPKWAAGVKALAEHVRRGDFTTPFAEELACFWLERAEEIDELVWRAVELGSLLQGRPAHFVLCHADIHTFNVLIDADDRLFIVDWDEVQLAAKERDLMFVVDAAVGGVAVEQRAEDLFLRGYGDAEIDWVALAYYRYEWVVQELGEFGALVLLRDDVGSAMREAGLRGFTGIFKPGNVVEAARQSESKLRLDHRQ